MTEAEKAKENWRNYWNKPGVAESFGGKEELETNPKYYLEEKPIVDLIPNCETILDAGCGIGRYTALVKDKCKLYVGVDYSVAMLEQARKNNPYPNIVYIQGDLAEIDFEKALSEASVKGMYALKLGQNKFDVGLLIAIIRHLPTEKGLAVLRNVRNACRTLLFTATIIPEEEAIPLIIKGIEDNKIIDIPYHLSDIKKTLQVDTIDATKIGDRDPTKGIRYLFKISDVEVEELPPSLSTGKPWNRISNVRRIVGGRVS